MSISHIGRILALAAVLTATPAIAANQSVSPSFGPYYYSPGDLTELYVECNNRPSELETRACFSRLLTEANDRLDWAYDRLERIVDRYEPADRNPNRMSSYQYHAEKLIGAQSSWEAFKDYHCDFEGAILGDQNTAESIENMICRIMTINYHAERLLALADAWDPADLPAGAAGDPGNNNADVPCDTAMYSEWEVTCDQDRRYYAQTRNSDGELRVLPNSMGGYDLLIVDAVTSIDRSTPVDIRIDRGPARQFSPDSNSTYAAGRSNGILIRHSASVDRLISDMRSGGNVEVVYRDGSGRLQVAQYSLIGLTRSLEWVSNRRTGVRPTAQR